MVVCDVYKSRVQTFTRDGKLLSAIGQAAHRPGDFVRPKHLGVDSNGLLYVVDAAFNNVQIFDEVGKVMMFFGSVRAFPGAMDLPAGVFVDEDPADIALFKQYIHPAFDAERLVIVTNQFGDSKVAVYAQGHLKPGKTLADLGKNRATFTLSTTQPTSQPAAPGHPGRCGEDDGHRQHPAGNTAERPVAAPHANRVGSRMEHGEACA